MGPCIGLGAPASGPVASDPAARARRQRPKVAWAAWEPPADLWAPKKSGQPSGQSLKIAQKCMHVCLYIYMYIYMYTYTQKCMLCIYVSNISHVCDVCNVCML